MSGERCDCPWSPTTTTTRRPGARTASVRRPARPFVAPGGGRHRHRRRDRARRASVPRRRRVRRRDRAHRRAARRPECGCGNRGCWEQLGSAAPSPVAGSRRPRGTRTHLVRMSGGDPRRSPGRWSPRRRTPATRCPAASWSRWGSGSGSASRPWSTSSIRTWSWSEAGPPGRATCCWHRPRLVRPPCGGPGGRPHLSIVPARLGNDAGAIGAASLAFETVDGDGNEEDARMKLGVPAGVHRGPSAPTGRRGSRPQVGRRRRVRARPPVPARVLPALGTGPSRPGGFLPPGGRRGPGARAARRHVGGPCDPARRASSRSRRRPSTR